MSVRYVRTIAALSLLALGSFGGFVSATGCSVVNSLGPNCDRSLTGNEPIEYVEGAVESGVYMSSPWTGELLWFPAGMRYELRHDLGAMPRFVQLWLSFDHCGTKSSTVAPAAGNQAELREVTDEHLIIVNGSCSDYWLLVIAGTGDGEPDSPSMGDGGVEDAGDDAGACGP